MEVTVLIPRHVDEPVPTFASTPVFITLHVAQSRIVWRELVPCLFQKRRGKGRQQRQRNPQHRLAAQRKMLLCLLSHLYFDNNNNPPEAKNSYNMPNTQQQQQSLLREDENIVVEEDVDSNSNSNDGVFALLRQRRIRIGRDLLNYFLSASASSSLSSISYPSKKLILLIQPPKTIMYFEYHWEKILIHLEHRLILAQSLAGLYSTLGGGCFMTRRMSTAIVLAQQQQRMALILNDMDMYYKSQINAAYNFIYIGQFQAACTLLRQVRNAVMAQQMISSDNSRKHTLVLLRDTENEESSSSSSSSCLEDISNGNRQVRSSSSSRDKDNAKYRSAIVLLRMCRAARIFAKRVEKVAAAGAGHLGGEENNNTVPPPHNNNSAAAALPSLSPTPPSKTVDDYARIRLVQDQSTNKDLVGLI